MMRTGERVPAIRILDTRVDMVQMPDVMALMAYWIETEPHRLHHVVNTGMHGIMEAHKDPAFAAILNSADLLAPDGVLAILVARIHGYHIKKRDTGPDLFMCSGIDVQHTGFLGTGWPLMCATSVEIRLHVA